MVITVVGAGVIGLTTARALEVAGHDVQIVAAATGELTTSAVAGAIWFPYRAGPPAKVAAWAARTRAYLIALASADPSAGVDVLAGYEITNETDADPPRPWWAAGIEVTRAPAPVTGAPIAWAFVAPRVEPRVFLPWLTAQLRRPIAQRRVSALALADEPGDLVINCTGLGARALCGDEQLVGLRGQTLLTAPGSVDLGVSVTDDRDANAIFYVIPRRVELVLGGCSQPWPADEPPGLDPAISARIGRQAAALGVAAGPTHGERTALRPFRPEVRLERDPANPRIIHNYGHGGAGYTMCQGCAEDVVALVRAAQ